LRDDLASLAAGETCSASLAKRALTARLCRDAREREFRRLIASLRATFSGNLLTDPADTAAFLTDWRKVWTGTALAVAVPDSVDDVARIVRWCTDHRVAIVPQGGNTGQSGGSVPRANGQNIVLSLARLNRIRNIDPANNTMTVDAGCILQSVQEAAAEAGRYFPLSLGAEGSCTVGGNLATNAGGTAVLRYGNARDLCLGLEVVTATGDIWDGLKGLRKDNSGYDLRDLFIGAEGTLGVITGAVLKLFPMPAERATAFVAVASPHQAMALFDAMRSAHDTALTAFEIMSDVCLGLVLGKVDGARQPLRERHPWYVLAELSGDNVRFQIERSLAQSLEDGVIVDAVIAASTAQARALWALRESISPAQAADGGGIKHDIAVAVSQVADFVDEALAAVATVFPDHRPVTFGHLGDGNLHFNFSSAPGADQAGFQATAPQLNAIVHDVVRRYAGTISAEHGLGVLRRDEADAHRSPVERGLMRAIKTALDPMGIMNPGKLLP
jgi:FAD/FMN-containing dehydrogenase